MTEDAEKEVEEAWFKCSVKGKIASIYESKIIEAPSKKHRGQPFKVISSSTIKKEFTDNLESGLKTTLKLDGTSCFIDDFNGRPWLWARHDVKPNKAGDKRFKFYQNNKQQDSTQDDVFIWNMETDFKEFPEDWKSASGLPLDEVRPDTNGHLVGWVPIDPSLRKHLWHLSVVDLNIGYGLFLLYTGCSESSLKLSLLKLSKFKGKTIELIGTNVNGNPYNLGSKKAPVHVLVQHGEIPLPCGLHLKDYSHEEFKEWFVSNENGGVEGIVWHSSEGTMFKLHRNHLELPWPVENTYLSQLSVSIDMSVYNPSVGERKNELFAAIKKYDGIHLKHLDQIFVNQNEL